MTNPWIGSGPRYGLDWGGRSFQLALDAERPGLVDRNGAPGVLLGLDGVATLGRDGTGVLSGSSLVHHEILFGCVQAIYAPEDWGSLRVRAAWSPRGDGVLDLGIQLQTVSVGELDAVEVHVISDLGQDWSLVGNAATAPLLVDCPGPPGTSPFYLEMVHPDDSTRRTIERSRVLYALFGYDLERGVVLRGRLRGIWLPSRPDESEVARRLGQFLSEPLPLGI